MLVLPKEAFAILYSVAVEELVEMVVAPRSGALLRQEDTVAVVEPLTKCLRAL